LRFSDEPQVRKPAGESIELDDRRNRAVIGALILLQYPHMREKSITGARGAG